MPLHSASGEQVESLASGKMRQIHVLCVGLGPKVILTFGSDALGSGSRRVNVLSQVLAAAKLRYWFTFMLPDEIISEEVSTASKADAGTCFS